MNMSKPVIQVAIALLFHRSNVLVGWREAKQHQGNKYEFPGGKVEADETPQQACTREVQEEVGITLHDWYAFDCIQHQYDDVEVHLHIFKGYVTVQDLSNIQAPWHWYERHELSKLPFPKANDTIIQRLSLAPLIKISPDLNDLHDLPQDMHLYLRLPASDQVIQRIEALPQQDLAKLIVNIALWQQLNLIIQKSVSAVHYKHDQLMSLSGNETLEGINCIAACHDRDSVEQAQHRGMDAIIISPVLHTATHPDAQVLGWKGFKQLAEQRHVPIYALGGLKPSDLDAAQDHGAYGVAGISQF